MSSRSPRGSGRAAAGAFFALVVLVCLLTAAVVSWCLESIEGRQRRRMASSLDAVLSTTRGALDLWSRDLKTNASLWASRRDVRDAVRRQLLVPREAGALRGSAVAAELKLDDIVEHHHFLGVDVLALDGTEIASTSPGAVGTKTLAEIDPQPIAVARAGRVALGLPYRQPETGSWRSRGPALTLAAPVRDDAGAVVAILAFRVDPDRGLTHVTQLGRILETGETYAFDHEGRLITESRFDKQLRDLGLIPPGERGILTISIRDPGGNLVEGFRPPLPRAEQPLTRMARSAVAGGSGIDLDGYRDYRGTLVVGAWTWDDHLGFGLATEVNRAEAYSLFTYTRRLALSIFGVAVVSTLCLTLLLAALAQRLQRSHSQERAARSSLEDQRVRLDQAEAELAAAIHTRDEFLRNASHELRTPITSLTLLYQHLLRGTREDGALRLPPWQLERFMRTSGRQFARLSQTIDNLLDTTKEAKGRLRLDLEELDLGDIAREAVERARDQLAEAGSRLDLDLGAPVIGHWDRLRMRHALCNLVHNAARYGLGKPVRVELRRVAAIARLSIEDHGVGIAEEDLGRVFDRFTRIGPLRPISGLGMGLHLARTIVEAHGGTLRVASVAGHGSTFTIELPLNPVDGPERDAGGHGAP